MLVQLLGGVVVRDGSRAVELAARRARVVVAALALADGVAPADRLAAAVWGDELPPTWQPALRGVVRQVRTTLAPMTVIATAPTGYVLAPGVEVDVRLALDGARRAGELLAEGRQRAALEAAEAAASASGARLLAGEDAEWLAPHRAALDEAAARALDVLAGAATALGEHDRAIGAGRRAVAARPLDERAHRTLIRALDAAGDRAAAIGAYEDCRATLAEQLGVDPSAETVAVYLAAIADQAHATTARIPVDPSSFVGRTAELSAVADALGRPGLTTVVGRGGVGKSRLAMQAAARADAPGGRFWTSLAALAEDTLAGATVALALGLPVGLDDPEDSIAQHLAPLGRSVLVVDGCDVVVDGAASLVSALVASCPALTVLATSRVALGVEGETLVPVEPLPHDEQVRLLQDRVREGGGALEVDGGSAELVGTLCGRCDGLPLALELAAAQLTALPVGDLLDQLAELDVDTDDRLRAIARSSYDLLDADEAAVFRRFAVLDGAVGLPFVRSVVSGEGIAPVRVIRILRELGARGLVDVDRSGPRWRYRQDDDLHRFAGELLVSAGEEASGFGRLADAVRALLPDDARVAPAPYADEVSAVLDSVRALFGAALDGRADPDRCLELAFRLHRYWAATGVAEGRFWLRRLLGLGAVGAWTRYATYALGYLSYWSGATDEALRELQAAVAMFDGEPDPYVARGYIYVAGLLDDLDRPAEALDYVRRSIAAAEPFGTDLYVAAAMGLGSVLSERGDVSAARYARDAVERCRVDGSAEQMATLLPTAAMVCWQVGAFDEARAYVAEAWPMHTEAKRIARVVLLSTAAGLALGDGDLAGAIELGSTADAEAVELGVEREAPLIRSVLTRALLAADERDRAVAVARGGLDLAGAMEVGYPLAIALETAALVAADHAPAADVAALLAAARTMRAAGERPAPSALRAGVDELRARVGDGLDPGRADALALAEGLLSSRMPADAARPAH